MESFEANNDTISKTKRQSCSYTIKRNKVSNVGNVYSISRNIIKGLLNFLTKDLMINLTFTLIQGLKVLCFEES